MSWLFLIVGLGLLVAGAELLVRGGAALAARLGISSLVIGLTIVAYGTSSPELAVSANAVLSGQSDIALGNVVGSNVFNVLFILGLASLICPLQVSAQLVRVDVPVMVGVSAALLVMSLDGNLGRVDGILLLAGMAAYTFLVIHLGRKASSLERKDLELKTPEKSEKAAALKALVWNVFLCLAGLGTLIWGAGLFVDAAIQIARSFGISELVIALTIVAAGTSMPEVATSIMASIRKERDIAVGNVVGSNIFNILGILGVCAVLAGEKGLSVPAGLMHFDYIVMLAAAAACLPIFFSGHTIARWEGCVFFFYYVIYTAYLILKASEHDQLPLFNHVVLYFVVPLSVLTAGVIYFQSYLGSSSSRRRHP